jgi:hypothetical protein
MSHTLLVDSQETEPGGRGVFAWILGSLVAAATVAALAPEGNRRALTFVFLFGAMVIGTLSRKGNGRLHKLAFAAAIPLILIALGIGLLPRLYRDDPGEVVPSPQVANSSTGPTDTVVVETRRTGAPLAVEPVPVRSPVILTGRFVLAAHEQLWPMLRPPVDSDARTSADKYGRYKVTTQAAIEPDEKGVWSTTADIGRGTCDEGKIYDFYIVWIKPSRIDGYRSFVDVDMEVKQYPEYGAPLPKEAKVIGHTRLLLVDYGGEHSGC